MVLRLFVNRYTKTLQVSDLSGGGFVLPSFAKYEAVPLEIVVVEPDQETAGLPRFSRVAIANLSCAVALNDTLDDASPLAYQPTFTKDETTNTFSGTLNLNTAALNTWLDANSKSAYFEIEIQEGSSVSKIYIATVTVVKSVAQVGATTPSPVDEYYTKAQADQQFLKPVGSAGVQVTITSPGGTYQRIVGVDDGGNAVDQIVAV